MTRVAAGDPDARSGPGTGPASGRRSGVSPQIPAQRWRYRRAGRRPARRRAPRAAPGRSGVVSSTVGALGLEARVALAADDEPAVRQLLPVVEAVRGRSAAGRTAARRAAPWRASGRAPGGRPCPQLGQRASPSGRRRRSDDGVRVERRRARHGCPRRSRRPRRPRLRGEPPHPARGMERAVARMEERAAEQPVERRREPVEPLGGEAVRAERVELAARARSRSASSTARRRLPTRRKVVAGQLRHPVERALGEPPEQPRRTGAQGRASPRRSSGAPPRRAKPPFRPLAPPATSRASCSRTRSPRSASVRAHEQPVTPPPTTATSAVPRTVRRAIGSRGSASQYEVVAAAVRSSSGLAPAVWLPRCIGGSRLVREQLRSAELPPTEHPVLGRPGSRWDVCPLR